jgi:hypothetical protein
MAEIILKPSTAKPTRPPSEDAMISHLSGEAIATFGGSATADQMRVCMRAARLAVALTDLWK